MLTSRYDVGTLLYHASFDVHPPLYYLLLHGWMVLFGDGIMAARSLSTVFGVVTLAMRFARWLANERAALMAGWLMAIMPMAVRYSREARMYALMGMLAIAAAVCWRLRKRRITAAGAVCAVDDAELAAHFTIFTLILAGGVSCRAAVKAYVPHQAATAVAGHMDQGWLHSLAAGAVQSGGSISPNCGRRRSVGSLRSPAICGNAGGVSHQP